MQKKFFITLALFLPFFARAATELTYTLSSPLPGGGTGVQTVTGKDSFIQYISFLFPFLLSIAAISALIMFILGGIQYALGGASPEQMKGAKERISNAIWGLLLAVFSVLILQTINPELVKLNLVLDEAGNTAATSGPIPTNGSNGSSCATNDQCTSGLCATPDGSPTGPKRCFRAGIPLGSECTVTEQCDKNFTSPLRCISGFCRDH